MKRLLVLAAAALAVAGCHKSAAPTPAANDASANITTIYANAMPDDANITDVPADDGDAPSDTETNAR